MYPGVCQWMQYRLSRRGRLRTADLSSPQLLPHSLTDTKLTRGSSLLWTANKVCTKDSVSRCSIISQEVGVLGWQTYYPPNSSPIPLITLSLPGVLAFCGLLTNCVPRGQSVIAVTSFKMTFLFQPPYQPCPPHTKCTWGSCLLWTVNKLCAQGSVCDCSNIFQDDVSLPTPISTLSPTYKMYLGFLPSVDC